jgi:hypothetical protein
MFLTENKVVSYTNELMSVLKLNDTIEIKNNIKEYLIYFIKVKKIINI